MEQDHIGEELTAYMKPLRTRFAEWKNVRSEEKRGSLIVSVTLHSEEINYSEVTLESFFTFSCGSDIYKNDCVDVISLKYF